MLPAQVGQYFMGIERGLYQYEWSGK